MNKVYAVFTQYYPDHKYEPMLQSLWTTLDKAEKEMLKQKEQSDLAWVEEYYLDSPYLNLNPEELKDERIHE